MLLRARGCCEACGELADLDDPLQGHHVTSQQVIRKRAARADADELRVLLWDRTNGMAVHQSCHAAHTNQTKPIAKDRLRPEHWEFARALGLDYLLDRLYA